MRVGRAVVVVALGPALGLSGCSAGSGAVPLSARQTVLAYYGVVDAHRWGRAEALLAPAQRNAFSEAPDSDRNNTVSVRSVRVRIFPAPFERGAYPGFSDIQQAGVSYEATYRTVLTTPDGPQFRFVYVGRTGTSGPWRILGIGTGP